MGLEGWSCDLLRFCSPLCVCVGMFLGNALVWGTHMFMCEQKGISLLPMLLLVSR